MSEYIFLFDLDSTISKVEILPTIAKNIGLENEMRDLTEATMRGEIPFKTSFLNRVNLLSSINVSTVNKIVSDIPLDKDIANFIKNNHERCYVVTGNINVWISGLMKKLKMENNHFCSKVNVKEDKISDIISIVDKELIVQQIIPKFIAIGDGSNDVGMAKHADIAIGYGGVREIAPSLLNNLDFAFYDGKKCVEFLEKLL